MNSDSHYSALQQQLKKIPGTIKQLKYYGVTEEHQLQLEYFFYTDSEEKAMTLGRQLRERGYTVTIAPSSDESNRFLITGWTRDITITEKSIRDWTISMCESGQECDCEFDGWGATIQ